MSEIVVAIMLEDREIYVLVNVSETHLTIRASKNATEFPKSGYTVSFYGNDELQGIYSNGEWNADELAALLMPSEPEFIFFPKDDDTEPLGTLEFVP